MNGEPQVGAKELAVRWERQDIVLVIWLSGAIDRRSARLLDREIQRATGMMRLIVDLIGLQVIDSAGLEALVGIHSRASRRGERLSFRHGQHVALRPDELTRTVRLRSRRAARTTGDALGQM